MAATISSMASLCSINFRHLSCSVSNIGSVYARCLSTTCVNRAKQPHSQPGSNLHERADLDYWQPVDDGKPKKFISPEFFPPKHRPGRRSKLRDYLERQDMLRRRKVLNIPEFYVGSIVAITMSDPCAPGKKSRFAGICIKRGGFGLGATCTLRNVIDGLGTEVCYELYNPLILNIEILKLEKSVDEHLLYLRDALPQYSTFDSDMVPINHNPGDPIPINDIQVRMKPRPWGRKWERYHLEGISYEKVKLRPKDIDNAEIAKAPWRKHDFARKYQQPPDLVEQIRKELDDHDEEKDEVLKQ